MRERVTIKNVFRLSSGIYRILFSFLLFFSVQYIVHLYGYLKAWRKNPHWSFSCCLAFILPLVSLPGDISGLVGNNIVNNQLQTGEIEIPTITAAVQDSGAINVTLEEGEPGDGGSAEPHDDRRNDALQKTGQEEVQPKAAARQDSETVQVSEQGVGNSAKVLDDSRGDIQSKKEEKKLPTSAAVMQDNGSTDATINSVKKKDGNRTGTHPKSKENKMRSNAPVMQNSGAVCVTFKEAEDDDDHPKKVQHDNCQDLEYNIKTRHKGTQTELSVTFSIADVSAHGPVEETAF